MNNTTVKTFWDLTPNDEFDICVVKIKYSDWVPEVEDISWYSDQTQSLIKCILKSVISSRTNIKFDDNRLDVSSSSSGVAKGYAWAKLDTNKCGYFMEYRIYFTAKNKIQFCSKLDPVDELVSMEQTKFAPW